MLFVGILRVVVANKEEPKAAANHYTFSKDELAWSFYGEIRCVGHCRCSTSSDEYSSKFGAESFLARVVWGAIRAVTSGVICCWKTLDFQTVQSAPIKISVNFVQVLIV